jgi:hypothetical protein
MLHHLIGRLLQHEAASTEVMADQNTLKREGEFLEALALSSASHHASGRMQAQKRKTCRPRPR